MCGVHGMIGEDRGETRRMVEACRHRGPDGDSVASAYGVTLGHNLLALRDQPIVSAQPLSLRSGRLVYNGELYDDLPGLDTIRLGEALLQDGWRALPLLDGMYAFAWHAYRDHSILLGRDRLGAKPLYYTQQDGRLLFSSELRGLLAAGVVPHLDPWGLRLFLEFGYVPGPTTLVSGVSKLAPGEYRLYDVSTACLREVGNIGQASAVTEFDAPRFRDNLVESVRRCMATTRPTGLFLSGGMDSSSVLWALKELGQRINTLSTRFDPCEPKYAEDLAAAASAAAVCGASHREILFTEGDYLNALPAALAAVDDPVVSKGVPAYWMTYREAARSGWVVVLTGDGGDELLSGYDHHRNFFDLSNYSSPISAWLQIHRNGGVDDHWQGDPVSVRQLESYFESWVPSRLFGADPLRNELELEGICHLAEDYLTRNDRLGMSHGLECRMPLLHEPFRSYAMGLPSAIKVQGEVMKWPIRKALRKRLPDAVTGKTKTGWAPPLGAWLQGKTRYAGQVGALMRDTVRPGRVPVLDRFITFDGLEQRIKLFTALFYLILWAERIGLVA